MVYHFFPSCRSHHTSLPTQRMKPYGPSLLQRPIITICALTQVCTWQLMQFTCASVLNTVGFFTGAMHKLQYRLWCWGECHPFHLVKISCHLPAMTYGAVHHSYSPTSLGCDITIIVCEDTYYIHICSAC